MVKLTENIANVLISNVFAMVVVLWQVPVVSDRVSKSTLAAVVEVESTTKKYR